MPLSTSGPKEMGYYFALGQVGLEMAVPIGLGAVIDHYAGSGPWGAVGGAALGLVVGMTHLIVLVNRQPKQQDGSGRDSRR